MRKVIPGLAAGHGSWGKIAGKRFVLWVKCHLKWFDLITGLTPRKPLYRMGFILVPTWLTLRKCLKPSHFMQINNSLYCTLTDIQSFTHFCILICFNSHCRVGTMFHFVCVIVQRLHSHAVGKFVLNLSQYFLLLSVVSWALNAQ